MSSPKYSWITAFLTGAYLYGVLPKNRLSLLDPGRYWWDYKHCEQSIGGCVERYRNV